MESLSGFLWAKLQSAEP